MTISNDNTGNLCYVCALIWPARMRKRVKERTAFWPRSRFPEKKLPPIWNTRLPLICHCTWDSSVAGRDSLGQPWAAWCPHHQGNCSSDPALLNGKGCNLEHEPRQNNPPLWPDSRTAWNQLSKAKSHHIGLCSKEPKGVVVKDLNP